MRNRAILAGTAGLWLSACASFPDLPDGPEVDAYAIIRSIECELAAARLDLKTEYAPSGRYWLDNWAVGMELELKAKRSGGATAALDLGWPIDGGSGGVKLGGTFKGVNEGFGKFSYSANLEDLEPCDGAPTEGILTGDVGAGSWLRRVGRAMGETGNEPTGITYWVEFVVSRSADGGPKFKLVPVGDASLDAALTLTGEAEDRHRLTLTFSRLQIKPPAAAAPAKAAARPAAPRKGKPPVDPATQKALDESRSRLLLQDLVDELRDEDD